MVGRQQVMRRASEDGATLDKSYSSLASVFLDNLDDDFLEREGRRLEVEETGTEQHAAHPHHELEEQSCADRFRDSASCPSSPELGLKVTRADDDSDDRVQAKLSTWATELVDRLELRSCRFEQVAFEATAGAVCASPQRTVRFAHVGAAEGSAS